MVIVQSSLQRDGHLICRGAYDAAALHSLSRRADALEPEEAGDRGMLSLDWCRNVGTGVARWLRERGLLEVGHVAVQCTLFRKTAGGNWLVPAHQDLSVPVAGKIEHPQLSGWSVKQGRQHVQPPVELLERLLAVRLHVDRCGPDDGPLRVVPGSHRFGRLDSQRIQALKSEFGEHPCEAGAGDLLLMKPLLVHASSRAREPRGQRRVLHFLYGPAEPGYGLRWSVEA